MRPCTRLVASLLVLGFAVATPCTPARAEQGAGIDLQAFRPAMDSRGFVTVDGADVLGRYQLSLGLVTTWADDVLRLDGPGGTTYAVDTLVSPTLLAAVGLEPLGVPLELGLALPFGVMAGDRGPDSDGATPGPNDDRAYRFGGQGLGNVGLRAKLRLRSPLRGRFGLALVAGVAIPTSTARDSWLADDATSLEVRLIAERARRRWRVAASIGLRSAGDAVFRDVMTDGDPSRPVTGHSVAGAGDAFAFGAAASYALDPGRFDLIAEVFGARSIRLGDRGDGDAEQRVRPLEALAGIKLYLARASYLTLGAGAGLRPDAAGSPDVRAFIGIVFEPRRADRPDRDLERVRIAEAPPADREPVAGPPDRCPDGADDLDGFEDDDGCPDLDNDRDHILDVDDLCPDAAEDVDGFEDEDGCPDLDDDRDHILDVDDRCPREKETYDGNADDDGCPDGRSLTFDDGGALVLDSVYFEFDSAVIAARSHPILRAVARTILDNPAIARLEVQGHTDDRGADAYNLRLSQARAAAVRAFLVAEGVAATRLAAEGYGERMPLVRRRTAAARARNRRVEFVILERARGR